MKLLEKRGLAELTLICEGRKRDKEETSEGSNRIGKTRTITEEQRKERIGREGEERKNRRARRDDNKENKESKGYRGR